MTIPVPRTAAPHFFDALPDRKQLRKELRTQLEQADDFQDVLDIVRSWTKDRQFQVGVRIVVPPFPYNDPETLENTSKDSVILFKTPSREGIHIEDVCTINDEWLVTGTSGVVLIVCGTGASMKQAQRQAYNRVRNVMIPNMYYREDIGDRWLEEDSDRLHSWGYLRE